jgi:hypothetical protein
LPSASWIAFTGTLRVTSFLHLAVIRYFIPNGPIWFSESYNLGIFTSIKLSSGQSVWAKLKHPSWSMKLNPHSYNYLLNYISSRNFQFASNKN